MALIGSARVSRLALATVWFVAAGACTEAGIQYEPPPELGEFNDRLEIRGEFCTQPDSQIEFPVKVLFVLDQSASLQCTDSRNRRFDAMRGLVDQLLSIPATSIGYVGFSSWARSQDFTTSRDDLRPILDPAGGLGTATDYQGALATALRTLENDMIEAGATERARTRYVVVFVSDGVPEPRCNAGCEDDMQNCSDGNDNDGDGRIDGGDQDCANIGNAALSPDSLYGICNFTGDLDLPDDEYVEFEPICPAYNQPELVLRRVADLMALRDIYSTGTITLNTVLLFSPQEVVEGICPGASTAFGYDRMQASSILRAMATEGEGTFRDVNLEAADDQFLQFDFRSLEAPQWLSNLLVANQFARPSLGGFESDRDRDGLSDSVEIELGTDPDSPDSDLPAGDGYSDLLEVAMESAGFDPIDPNAPQIACSESSDLDGDRLLDCEEAFLETDPRHPDSDGDGVFDWLEVAVGTDPTVDDGFVDDDFDGIANAEETAGGTDPQFADADRYRNDRIQYRIEDRGDQEVIRWETGETEERHCYAFETRNIQLVDTQIVRDRGLNRLLVYAHEEPAMLPSARSVTHVACFEAIYLGGRTKVPADGIIDASNEGWFDTLTRLQTSIDSLATCPWLGAGFNRRDAIDAVHQCLPDPVVLGGFVFNNAETEELIRTYVASDTAVNIPQPASELFVPIESFDVDQHCVRPWEVDRVTSLFDQVLAACTCTPDETDGTVSPCCEP